MGDILKRINNTVCIVITWIYAPFVTCMRVSCKLQKCKCQIELCLYHCLLGLTTREGCTWLLTCYKIIRGSRTWRTLGQKTVNKQIRTTYICHKQDTHFKIESNVVTLILYAIRSYMLKFSFCISCFMRSVALPSSIKPRRMSEKSLRDSLIGRSLQGLSFFSDRYNLISSAVCNWQRPQRNLEVSEHSACNI